jgi:hypothetical protein
MGEGGGNSSARGEVGLAASVDGEVTDEAESRRLMRGAGDLLLLPDFTEAASDFSGGSTLANTAEVLGLSVLLEPGILERRARKERDDSLVSDLLNEGYDCSVSSAAALDEAAPASLEFWLPIVSHCDRERSSDSEKSRGWTACACKVVDTGRNRLCMSTQPTAAPVSKGGIRFDRVPGVLGRMVKVFEIGKKAKDRGGTTTPSCGVQF